MSNTLERNAKLWILDRVANRESLMYREFKSFMIRMGFSSKQIQRFKSKMIRIYIKKKFKR